MTFGNSKCAKFLSHGSEAEDLELEARRLKLAKRVELKEEKKAKVKEAKEARVVAVRSARKYAPPPPPCIPEGATVVGLDLGIVNIFGCAREDELGEKKAAWTASARRFRHLSGEAGRRYAALNDRRAEELANFEFSEAHRLVDAVSTKTADPAKLLEAIAVRGGAYPILFSFYGSGRAASRRFLNFSGRQRELSRLVRRVVRKETDVFAVGDASFGSTVKGHPPGLARKFLRALKDAVGSARVVECDEYRTSVLDSGTARPAGRDSGEARCVQVHVPLERRDAQIYEVAESRRDLSRRRRPIITWVPIRHWSSILRNSGDAALAHLSVGYAVGTHTGAFGHTIAS